MVVKAESWPRVIPAVAAAAARARPRAGEGLFRCEASRASWAVGMKARSGRKHSKASFIALFMLRSLQRAKASLMHRCSFRPRCTRCLATLNRSAFS